MIGVDGCISRAMDTLRPLAAKGMQEKIRRLMALARGTVSENLDAKGMQEKLRKFMADRAVNVMRQCALARSTVSEKWKKTKHDAMDSRLLDLYFDVSNKERKEEELAVDAVLERQLQNDIREWSQRGGLEEQLLKFMQFFNGSEAGMLIFSTFTHMLDHTQVLLDNPGLHKHAREKDLRRSGLSIIELVVRVGPDHNKRFWIEFTKQQDDRKNWKITEGILNDAIVGAMRKQDLLGFETLLHIASHRYVNPTFDFLGAIFVVYVPDEVKIQYLQLVKKHLGEQCCIRVLRCFWNLPSCGSSFSVRLWMSAVNLIDWSRLQYETRLRYETMSYVSDQIYDLCSAIVRRAGDLSGVGDLPKFSNGQRIQGFTDADLCLLETVEFSLQNEFLQDYEVDLLLKFICGVHPTLEWNNIHSDTTQRLGKVMLTLLQRHAELGSSFCVDESVFRRIVCGCSSYYKDIVQLLIDRTPDTNFEAYGCITDYLIRYMISTEYANLRDYPVHFSILTTLLNKKFTPKEPYRLDQIAGIGSIRLFGMYLQKTKDENLRDFDDMLVRACKVGNPNLVDFILKHKRLQNLPWLYKDVTPALAVRSTCVSLVLSPNVLYENLSDSSVFDLVFTMLESDPHRMCNWMEEYAERSKWTYRAVQPEHALRVNLLRALGQRGMFLHADHLHQKQNLSDIEQMLKDAGFRVDRNRNYVWSEVPDRSIT